MDHARQRFDSYLDALAACAERLPDVVGLVGFGSTADRSRADEWSDHDFAWVTAPGAEDTYRRGPDWLPDGDRVALWVVEHHGGVKAIYDDGHVLEFGICSVASLRTWVGNCADVIVDKGGVAQAVAHVLAAGAPVTPDDARDIRLVLTQILIGVGRSRRGEVLSAGRLIREDATVLLLGVLGRRLPGGEGMLDNLDPARRFERAHPELAARIAAAVRGTPEEAGRRLLDIAEEQLAAGWDAFPRRGLVAVRGRLGW